MVLEVVPLLAWHHCSGIDHGTPALFFLLWFKIRAWHWMVCSTYFTILGRTIFATNTIGFRHLMVTPIRKSMNVGDTIEADFLDDFLSVNLFNPLDSFVSTASQTAFFGPNYPVC